MALLGQEFCSSNSLVRNTDERKAPPCSTKCFLCGLCICKTALGCDGKVRGEAKSDVGGCRWSWTAEGYQRTNHELRNVISLLNGNCQKGPRAGVMLYLMPPCCASTGPARRVDWCAAKFRECYIASLCSNRRARLSRVHLHDDLKRRGKPRKARCECFRHAGTNEGRKMGPWNLMHNLLVFGNADLGNKNASFCENGGSPLKHTACQASTMRFRPISISVPISHMIDSMDHV